MWQMILMIKRQVKYTLLFTIYWFCPPNYLCLVQPIFWYILHWMQIWRVSNLNRSKSLDSFWPRQTAVIAMHFPLVSAGTRTMQYCLVKWPRTGNNQSISLNNIHIITWNKMELHVQQYCNVNSCLQCNILPTTTCDSWEKHVHSDYIHTLKYVHC